MDEMASSTGAPNPLNPIQQQQNSEGMSAPSPQFGQSDNVNGWFDILDAEVMDEQQQQQQQQLQQLQQLQQQQAIINSLLQPGAQPNMITGQSSMSSAQAPMPNSQPSMVSAGQPSVSVPAQQTHQSQQTHTHGQQQQQRPQYVQYTIQPVIQGGASQQQQQTAQQHLQHQMSQQQPLFHALQALQPMPAPVPMPIPAAALAPADDAPAAPAEGGGKRPRVAKSASEERAAARMERKRDREKRRREDVNRQFDELTALLQKVAPLPGDRAPGEEGGDKIPSTSSTLAGPSNREALLRRTCSVVQEIHEERTALRDQVMDLRRRLIESKTNAGCRCGGSSTLQHQVMMMVPMMVPIESVPTNGIPVARVPMADVRNGLIIQTAPQALECSPDTNAVLSQPSAGTPPAPAAPASPGGTPAHADPAKDGEEEAGEGRRETSGNKLAYLSELTAEDKEPGAYAHCA